VNAPIRKPSAHVRFLTAFDACLYRMEVATSEAFRTGGAKHQNTPDASAEWEKTRHAGEELIRELATAGHMDAAEAVQSLLNGGTHSELTAKFKAIRPRLQVLAAMRKLAELRERFNSLGPIIREAIDRTNAELASRGLPYDMASEDDVCHMARMAGKDPSGMTAAEAVDWLVAWHDAEIVKAKLAQALAAPPEKPPEKPQENRWIGPMSAAAFGAIADRKAMDDRTSRDRLAKLAEKGGAKKEGRGRWVVAWSALTETQRKRAEANGH